ncbi:MAG: glutathione S-transferase family protein [Rhodobacteraceae bacterium]|nr:glutathione S-transferase family protein [Paracoccaceae bacterium]
MNLHLMSHALCPYVQRAVIALTEKGLAFERTTIDLAAKPAWFLDLSPLGKTPVLTVDGRLIFESNVILEYLEDTQPHPLHPADPFERARHRAWIEFGSAVLADIAGLYNAPNADAFVNNTAALRAKAERLETALDDGPFFGGARFGLVDAAFGPVFRYFDAFDRIGDFGILTDLPKLVRWRETLAARPSIRSAVAANYSDLLWTFLLNRGSHLTSLM